MPLKLISQSKGTKNIHTQVLLPITYGIISRPKQHYEPYSICAFPKDRTFLRAGEDTSRSDVCHPVSYFMAPIIPAPSEKIAT